MLIRLAIAGALALASLSVAFARNTGEWNDASPELRQWFKSVRSPNGIPCCDIADGHRATYRGANIPPGGYEVLIDGNWVSVPPEAVILGAANPTGEAIIWYAKYQDGEIHVRCFVLGTEG